MWWNGKGRRMKKDIKFGSELQHLSAEEVVELIESGRKTLGLDKEDMTKIVEVKQGMQHPPVQVEKYGAIVWSNAEMDELRKTECLCLNCSKMSTCQIAKHLYNACKDYNLAMMITRCPDWESK